MTESAPKRKSRPINSIILLMIALIGAGLIYGVTRKVEENCAFRLPDAFRPGKSGCVLLQTADTPEARKQGLSGRDNIAPTAGMLFIFDDSGRQCMWMKDMKFSIDMLWLDENKKILEIKKNIAPETYPESFCADGKYVVELIAGTSDRAGLTAGQYLAL